MPLPVQPPETDLFVPLPAPGEAMDPYTVHTHYFGFAVPQAELGCFIYLRYQPAFPLSQGGVNIFRGMNNDSVLDAEHVDYRITMPWPTVEGSLIRTDNGLEIEFPVPGEVALVRYASPDKAVRFTIEQRAVTPLLARGHIMPGEEDHHDPARATGGIEQFLHCTGELELRGERFDIDCMAVRDRSWLQVRREDPGGARRTPPLGWTPMYFGPDLALNAVSIEAPDTAPRWAGIYDVPDGTPTSFYAWLVRDGEPRRIAEVRRDVLDYHPTMYAATRQRLEITDAAGERYSFTGEAIAMSAIPAWPNVVFHDSVYRWTDEQGRVTHCTYQEIWFDEYQRAMKARLT
ncbi:MAG TPA: tyrosine protein kinase [Sporichthyaceae bacterium]|nr:tyrosine protein kinase [Sporichthyaceae bacterium]